MNHSPNYWQVEAQGCESDLEHLARHLISTPFRILKNEHDGKFVYESDSFMECQTSEDVLKHADDELSILSGVLKSTHNPSSKPLYSGAVYQCGASGKSIIIHGKVAELHLRAWMGEITSTDIDIEGNINTNLAPSLRMVTITKLSARDASVAKVMRLLAAQNHKTWVDMYRIHEVILNDIGGEKEMKKLDWGLGLLKDLKRFKHTANSVAAAGDSARHGKEIAQAPKHPMSIDEADAFLNNFLQAWLCWKISNMT